MPKWQRCVCVCKSVQRVSKALMQRSWGAQFKNKLSARLDLLCHTLATTAVSSVRVCECVLGSSYVKFT